MIARIAIVMLGIVIAAPGALAHGDADWINRGSLRNAAGELCCGLNDCKATPAQNVSLPTAGYRLPSGEFIPQTEAQPSPDGQFWICAWGGKRKCFFAPVPTF